MSSVHSLQVNLRVPIWIINDDMIGGHKIESKTTSFGRKQENEKLWLRLSEVIDHLLSCFKICASIKSAILEKS